MRLLMLSVVLLMSGCAHLFGGLEAEQEVRTWASKTQTQVRSLSCKSVTVRESLRRECEVTTSNGCFVLACSFEGCKYSGPCQFVSQNL